MTELNFKVIVVGSSAVGKSSIVSQLINVSSSPVLSPERNPFSRPFSREQKKFIEEHHSTKFVEFGAFYVTLSDSTSIKLQIWDTVSFPPRARLFLVTRNDFQCGEEEYRSVTANYYRGAHAALLVYDITRRSTFNVLQTWLDEIFQFSLPNVFVLVVGNKGDLEVSREVSYEEGHAFAQERGLAFIETSAKTTMNVEESFVQVAKEVYTLAKSVEKQQQQQQSGKRPPLPKLPSTGNSPDSKCCSR